VRKYGIMLAILMNLTLVVTAQSSTDEQVVDAPKSKVKGWMLSLGSTILPVALGATLTRSESEAYSDLGIFLIGGGLVLGPGAGHAYADRPVRFAAGAVVRTLCLGFAAFALAMKGQTIEARSFSESINVQSDESNLGFIIGMGGYTLTAVLDIATVGRSVDACNRKHAAPEFSVGHVYLPENKTHGLALTLRF